jgi:hypothetical protein
MKRQYPSIDELKRGYGPNKDIPLEYEEIILKALYHYPELQDVRIAFKLKPVHCEPYETIPLVGFKKSYSIVFREEGPAPLEKLLFKNLPEEAQLGILGHLLAHVVQYEKKGLVSMIKLASGTPERKVEREADVITIEHGLGFELYTFACFVRGIPGYLGERNEVDVNHLHPNEILEALPPDQLQEIHR